MPCFLKSFDLLTVVIWCIGHIQIDEQAIMTVVCEPDPPRVIFLTSPSNPTGDLVDREFLVKVLEASAA